MLCRSSKFTVKLKTLAVSGALVAVLAIAGNLVKHDAKMSTTGGVVERVQITYATVLR